MSRPTRQPDPKRRFGENVRRLRTAAGYSQDSFALHSGIHRTYIGGIERGERNPSLESIVRIATALGVPPADLLLGIGDPSG